MRLREEGQEPVTDHDGPCAGAASAVRLGEGLVQVGVHHVEAKLAQLDLAEQGVEVRAVTVHDTAGVADYLYDFGQVGVEDSKRARLGQHEAREVVADGGLEGGEIGIALFVGREGDDVEPRDNGGGGIGAVRAVGYQHLLALVVAA